MGFRLPPDFRLASPPLPCKVIKIYYLSESCG
jgi:hypothetical protein